MTWFYRFLADLLLTVHFVFVAFVILGFMAIWLGRLLHWEWIRNFRFRMAHLAAMGIVVLQAIFERICPLTTWEAQLRMRGGQDPRYDTTFMQYWLHQLLYWEWSPRVFLVIYVMFFLLIVASLWCVPPRKRVR